MKIFPGRAKPGRYDKPHVFPDEIWAQQPYYHPGRGHPSAFRVDRHGPHRSTRPDYVLIRKDKPPLIVDIKDGIVSYHNYMRGWARDHGCEYVYAPDAESQKLLGVRP